MIGTKVQLRTKEYVVPSLTFDEVERFSADGTLQKIPQKGFTLTVSPDYQAASMTVFLAALRWNYPEITREEIAREVDMENFERLVNAVMAASGLTAQAADAGEAAP